MSKSSVFHFVSQIRAKQLATRDTQNKILQKILDNKNPNLSDKELSAMLITSLKHDMIVSRGISDFLKTEKVSNVGYPIKFNKTYFQFKMALEWVTSSAENIVEKIEKGEFHHGLSNDIVVGELPFLQSDSLTSYWGNENSSVSSILLCSLAKVLKIEIDEFAGVGMWYPMFNEKYKMPTELVLESYKFAKADKVLLFGDYQYGGHRYLKDQFVFGPEDCSSAVAKSNYLENALGKTITTTTIKQGTDTYKTILVLQDQLSEAEIDLLQAGDVFVIGSHMGLFVDKPNQEGVVNTLQFKRQIGQDNNQVSGGGQQIYDLNETIQTNKIYILRSGNINQSKEDISLFEMVNRVDYKYTELFPEGPAEIAGDCQIFLE